ncbi:MAG TPA: hypothetical protein VEX18_20115 [Polyangiaceae bacterium]|nr:hypothetical protein [Polyangiaceae bacterium]
MSRTRFPIVLPAGVWLLASACGPGAATPMPQPPTVFDLSRVGSPGTLATSAGYEQIEALPGTVPARATVRVTNLDRPVQAAAVDALDNGSFGIAVVVSSGEELRFEWTDGNERSAPADAFFVKPDPVRAEFELQPSARFDCLELSPPYALDFAEADSLTLTLTNNCNDTLTLADPRARIGLPAFTLPADLPSLASGESSEVVVSFDGGDPAVFEEDTLLFDVTLGTETIRYPITLRGP